MGKKYKIVYVESEMGEFEKTLEKFEASLNALSEDGWIVKSSNITTLPKNPPAMAAYAILEHGVSMLEMPSP